jgi:hypothetical protein
MFAALMVLLLAASTVPAVAQDVCEVRPATPRAAAAALADARIRQRIVDGEAKVRTIAAAAYMYAAHMGAFPSALDQLTGMSRDPTGRVAGPFLPAIPEPPAGWTPYVYTRVSTDRATVEISGDETTIRCP